MKIPVLVKMPDGKYHVIHVDITIKRTSDNIWRMAVNDRLYGRRRRIYGR